uniref:Uncharacterized protein n=1 Tax=Arundo donax TaxID=35708 RepID=A0A0A9DRD8_ARUDO
MSVCGNFLSLYHVSFTLEMVGITQVHNTLLFRDICPFPSKRTEIYDILEYKWSAVPILIADIYRLHRLVASKWHHFVWYEKYFKSSVFVLFNILL